MLVEVELVTFSITIFFFNWKQFFLYLLEFFLCIALKIQISWKKLAIS